MPQNQFLPIAVGVGANTLAPATYAGAGFLPQGFESGVLPSIQFNTVLRQLSTVVAALAQFTADHQSADVLDDGVVANFEAKFTAALAGSLSASTVHYGVATGTGDSMVVTASPPLVAATGGGYQAGSFLVLKTPNTANATNAPVINANSIGNITIARRDGSAVAPSDLPANSLIVLGFDGTHCECVGILPSDIASIASSAITSLQAEVQDAIVGSGLAYNASDATQLAAVPPVRRPVHWDVRRVRRRADGDGSGRLDDPGAEERHAGYGDCSVGEHSDRAQLGGRRLYGRILGNHGSNDEPARRLPSAISSRPPL